MLVFLFIHIYILIDYICKSQTCALQIIVKLPPCPFTKVLNDVGLHFYIYKCKRKQI